MSVSSGLAAVTTTLSAYLKTGDHLLMVDSVFSPTRRYCENVLKKNGVEVTYYSPLLGKEIVELIKDNTKVIFLESPGSLTFEVQDIPAIVAVAKKNLLITVMDNTWSSPLYFQPLNIGINVSIYAATKHMGGHSDIVLGAIVTDKENWQIVRNHYIDIGQSPPTEEVYFALRGLKTLPLRLDHQGKSALKIALWLKQQKYVVKVLHPALEDCIGHKFWKRDFNGSSNLFAFELDKNINQQNMFAFVNLLHVFSIGASWGGGCRKPCFTL